MSGLDGPSLPVLGRRGMLTALREADVPRVLEACTTEAAERWLETPVPYRLEDAASFVREFVPAGWRGEHDERVWAIRESLSGPLMGVIGLREGSREVGFWLHPEGQGRGLMADAVRTAVGHADGCLTWPEVRWACFVGNVASMRVAKAAGFSYLGERDGLHRGRPARQHHAVRLASGQPPADALPWPDLA